LLASLLAILVVAELTARWLWREPTPRARRDPHPSDLPRLRGLQEIARPNVRGIFRGALYQTNSAGFRGPETPEEPEQGSFRIVVVGDSVTMGSGVTVEEAYPARLEQLLNAATGDRRYEVLNLGLAGLNLDANLNRLERLGLRFQPDLVVYGFTLNDAEGPEYVQFPHSPVRLDATPGSASILWWMLRPRLRSLRDLIRPGPSSYVYELDQNYFHNPGVRAALEAGFERLASVAASRGVCVGVFVHPRLYMLHFLHPFRRHYALVAELARKQGHFVSVAFPLLMGEDAASLWVGPFDPHPNARGHSLLAEALYEGLQELPRECWEPRRRPGRPAGAS
jgi:lysophospholipase L1-like esterase